MRERTPPLTPHPLPVLLGRIAREWESAGTVFDLPGARFHRATPACDLADVVAGLRVGTPAGVAAGPHTQLAQNIVLGWLAGARAFELKTVQVLDELEIERPCVDMATYGLNVEWSQELTLDASREEYAKAAILLAILREWPPLRNVLGETGAHVFELSVGYDLAGIVSARMGRLIDGLLRADDVLDELRRGLPEPFAAWRERALPGRLIAGATLSTFHGCPPAEIAAIVRHLMAVHGLDVTIKLNPTLLGLERTREILHHRLGFTELRLLPEAFAQDLALEPALALIRELAACARAQGRTLGLKLCNTLVIANDGQRLPGERVYLSGAPLHVLAISLLDLLRERLPGLLRLGPDESGEVQVAFSAGAAKENFAELVGLGLAPVTICSDLLKPAGYGRLAPMLTRLAAAMRDAGCVELTAWRRQRAARARAAGRPDAVAAYAASLATPEGWRPYARAVVARPPRKTPTPLARWDCTSCHLCVTVCPNDAMLALPDPARAVRDASEGRSRRPARQYVCLAELCNACGNCETFCPELGAPFAIKPRLFLDPERWQREHGPAFLVSASGSAEGVAFAVEASSNFVGEAAAAALAQTAPSDGERLSELINQPGGFPYRPRDLPGEETCAGGEV